MTADTLFVEAPGELTILTATAFLEGTRRLFRAPQRNIQIDLSQTTHVDSVGLSALISLHRDVARRNGFVQLLKPTSFVEKKLAETRTNRIFDIVTRSEDAASLIPLPA